MSTQAERPTISVIIPAYNAAHLLERVLAPLIAALERHEIDEIVVVDDASTDELAGHVARYPFVKTVRIEQQSGPAAARNRAAQHASGEILWFVDADVIVADDSARIVGRSFTAHDIVAVMGTYDDTPPAPNFLSQYKNLVHHFYHQHAKAEASTFWAGCGAVRKSAFLAIDGFDARTYRYPSIEDIDLGYRLRDAGGIIRLDRSLQGKHLKVWRLGNLLHTEIFRRAIPWSKLMLRRGALTNDLNIDFAERVRAVLVIMLLIATLCAVTGLVSWWIPGGLFALDVIASRTILSFFFTARGFMFMARAHLMHRVYYVYSSVAFAVAWLTVTLGG